MSTCESKIALKTTLIASDGGTKNSAIDDSQEKTASRHKTSGGKRVNTVNYTSIDLDDIDCPLEFPRKSPRPKGIFDDSAVLDFRGIGQVIKESDAVASIAAELEQLSRQELDNRMVPCRVRIAVAAEQGKIPADAQRLDYWLLNCEYTRRGIPPVFRKLPEPNTDVRELVGDAFAVDLQWLVSRSSDHESFRRWAGLWKPGQFHSTAKWVSGSYPRNKPHWFVRGLGLTEGQQLEMHLVKQDCFRTRYERAEERLDEIKLRLLNQCQIIGRDSRHRSKDPEAAVERRAGIWLIAEAFDLWKDSRPQRLADLHEARTGERLSRQIIDKTFKIVQRDLPETRPKRLRPGPKKRQI